MSEEKCQDGDHIEFVSFNRITKFSMVENTLHTSMKIYEKIKDYNRVTNWTFSTAESNFHKVITIGAPYLIFLAKSLQVPLKNVDNILCVGLDYLETKNLNSKLPSNELSNSTYNVSPSSASEDKLNSSANKPELNPDIVASVNGYTQNKDKQVEESTPVPMEFLSSEESGIVVESPIESIKFIIEESNQSCKESIEANLISTPTDNMENEDYQDSDKCSKTDSDSD